LIYKSLKKIAMPYGIQGNQGLFPNQLRIQINIQLPNFFTFRDRRVD
jgi:hypothetical protein